MSWDFAVYTYGENSLEQATIIFEVQTKCEVSKIARLDFHGLQFYLASTSAEPKK